MRILDDGIEEKKYQSYLLNLIPIIKKQAEEAKTEANTPKEKREDDMTQGVLIGYYSIITLFKHEAFTFCIYTQTTSKLGFGHS